MFGRVFIAEDKEIAGRTVAIKQFVLESVGVKRSLEREVALMKDLDHPNICKIFETYDLDSTFWVVMECCSGGDLCDRIMDHGPLEEWETARIVRQVAGAMKYAHARGIAHRDLKPDNVCFCSADGSNDQVKVIDWGVGAPFWASSMQSVVGSREYMAPEVLQARGTSHYSALCDMWSLGVMIYVMLCGRPPFWGPPAVMLAKMMREEYPMADEPWRGISDMAKDLIRRLLKVDLTLRLSADALLVNPWLVTSAEAPQVCAGRAITRRALSSCRSFCKRDNFYKICAAAAAKQLDHSRLQDVRKVFLEMDTDKDGVLELREFMAGFVKAFDRDTATALQVQKLFKSLDLDGSGVIDYTEFCAACLDLKERAAGSDALDEITLRAAFKAFDVIDDNNRISRDELERVLISVEVGENWSKEVAELFTDEVYRCHDTNQDGWIDFEEFLRLMRERRSGPSGAGRSSTEVMRGALGSPTASRPVGRTPTPLRNLISFDRGAEAMGDAAASSAQGPAGPRRERPPPAVRL